MKLDKISKFTTYRIFEYHLSCFKELFLLIQRAQVDLCHYGSNIKTYQES